VCISAEDVSLKIWTSSGGTLNLDMTSATDAKKIAEWVAGQLV
jgi:hypothetical protein